MTTKDAPGRCREPTWSRIEKGRNELEQTDAIKRGTDVVSKDLTVRVL